MKSLRLLLVAVILTLVFSAQAWAVIPFAWNAPLPEDNVLGWTIYMEAADGKITPIPILIGDLDDPNNPTHVLENHPGGQLIFWLRAYNDVGLSDPTAKVSTCWCVPQTPVNFRFVP